MVQRLPDVAKDWLNVPTVGEGKDPSPLGTYMVPGVPVLPGIGLQGFQELPGICSMYPSVNEEDSHLP